MLISYVMSSMSCVYFICYVFHAMCLFLVNCKFFLTLCILLSLCACKYSFNGNNDDKNLNKALRHLSPAIVFSCALMKLDALAR